MVGDFSRLKRFAGGKKERRRTRGRGTRDEGKRGTEDRRRRRERGNEGNQGLMPSLRPLHPIPTGLLSNPHGPFTPSYNLMMLFSRAFFGLLRGIDPFQRLPGSLPAQKKERNI